MQMSNTYKLVMSQYDYNLKIMMCQAKVFIDCVNTGYMPF